MTSGAEKISGGQKWFSSKNPSPFKLFIWFIPNFNEKEVDFQTIISWLCQSGNQMDFPVKGGKKE